MAIDFERLKAWPFEDVVTPYSADDCILYALGLGYGSDPLDMSELPYVYEQDLLCVPTMVTTLGAPGAWAADPRTGIDWRKILHGEHQVIFHAPLPATGSLRSRTRVCRVVDKGAGRGALVATERQVSDEATGQPIATIVHTSFCRSDGGIGRSDAPGPALPTVPEAPPELTVCLATNRNAALLYRLNGDHNPLHADPLAATAAGLAAPILHGLCTFGMAARAILRSFAPTQPARLKQLALRFSAPFLPGETLRVDMWRRDDRIHFRGIAAERGTTVLTHGLATIQEN